MIRHGLLLFLIIPTITFGKTFRIAALYATSNQGQNNFGYGLEAACMTRAVVEDAQEKGMPVTLESFDLGPSAASTAQTAQRISEGKFDVALGTLTSMEAIAASRVFESAKLPFINPTATNPEVTENKKYVTRIPFTDSRQAELLSKFTVQELKPKVVVIIRNASNTYSDYLGKEYRKRLESAQSDIKVHDLPIIDGLDDHGALIASILAAKPDVIFVPVLQSTVASLYAELTRLKVKTTLLGSDIVESDVNFMRVLGRTNPSIRFVFVQHWNRKYEGLFGKTYQRLHKKYCAQYRPSMVTAAVFDATTLLLETVKKYPAASKDAFIEDFKRLKFIGLTGPMVYDASGNVLKPLQLFTVQNNETVFWKAFE